MTRYTFFGKSLSLDENRAKVRMILNLTLFNFVFLMGFVFLGMVERLTWGSCRGGIWFPFQVIPIAGLLVPYAIYLTSEAERKAESIVDLDRVTTIPLERSILSWKGTLAGLLAGSISYSWAGWFLAGFSFPPCFVVFWAAPAVAIAAIAALFLVRPVLTRKHVARGANG